MNGGKRRVSTAIAGFFFATLLGGCSIGGQTGQDRAVFFSAEEEGGIDVSMVGAARELGISEAINGSSLHLTGERLDSLAKQ
ncbi:hypothetical protein [Microbacterium testaceum]|uniref:hypothetical protein n=1 Tax=Microbacterium testaceum TaxID=2033 RepID=UPI00243492B1|nr:hypothetical protein [Microbacterium testaceum]